MEFDWEATTWSYIAVHWRVRTLSCDLGRRLTYVSAAQRSDCLCQGEWWFSSRVDFHRQRLGLTLESSCPLTDYSMSGHFQSHLAFSAMIISGFARYGA